MSFDRCGVNIRFGHPLESCRVAHSLRIGSIGEWRVPIQWAIGQLGAQPDAGSTGGRVAKTRAVQMTDLQPVAIAIPS